MTCRSTFRILSVAATLFSVGTPDARAWGHLTGLADKTYSSAYLIHDVLERGKIAYCVDLQTDKYQATQLRAQIEMGFRLWLKPLESIGIPAAEVTEVPCDRPHDVQFGVGPNSRSSEACTQPHLGADGKSNILIKLNSDFVSTSETGGTTHAALNFTQFNSTGDFAGLLEEISVTHPLSVREFARRHGHHWLTVYFSSYPSILHELGHAFGLCDLTVPETCDAGHMSTPGNQDQPEALMKYPTYFYLTDDDIAGMRSLAERFRMTP